MKVLSLTQPWATLVVIGAKKIETRSWKPRPAIYEQISREGFLIHASKKMGAYEKVLCDDDPFLSALKDLEELPLGVIIGKVEIAGFQPTEVIKSERITRYRNMDWHFTEEEERFGDYKAGRIAWLLYNPVSFINHIKVSGSLSMWDYEDRICLQCGCTDFDCKACTEKTGRPCYWIGPATCSACLPEPKRKLSNAKI